MFIQTDREALRRNSLSSPTSVRPHVKKARIVPGNVQKPMTNQTPKRLTIKQLDSGLAGGINRHRLSLRLPPGWCYKARDNPAAIRRQCRLIIVQVWFGVRALEWGFRTLKRELQHRLLLELSRCLQQCYCLLSSLSISCLRYFKFRLFYSIRPSFLLWLVYFLQPFYLFPSECLFSVFYDSLSVFKFLMNASDLCVLGRGRSGLTEIWFPV